MNTNKITVIGSIIVIILIITIPTIYKVVSMHHDNLYRVVEDKIIEKAKKCRNDGICLNDKITLVSEDSKTYEFQYIEKMSDPVTKEYYNENSYITIDNEQYKFVSVE